MRLSWSRIFLITLLAITLLWIALLYESIQQWHRYLDLWYEWAYFETRRVYEESGRNIFLALLEGYFDRLEGKIVMAIGLVLLCSWVLTAREKWREFKDKRSRV